MPPVTRSLPEDDLKKFIDGPNLLSHVFEFPCHTQAVERCVKVVTEASTHVYGEKTRDGYIRAISNSRSVMSSFEHKAQFQTELFKRISTHIVS